jgi:hypothetical protein
LNSINLGTLLFVTCIQKMHNNYYSSLIHSID